MAAVSLDASPPSPRYSEDLKKMFEKINPYNLSCLYKTAFEEHATDALRDIDEGIADCKPRRQGTEDDLRVQDHLCPMLDYNVLEENHQLERASHSSSAISMSEIFDALSLHGDPDHKPYATVSQYANLRLRINIF